MNENVSLSIQLLQPELLLKSTLIDILQSRCVSGDFSSWDKEKLLDLYRRVVLPLPQRDDSRANWRRSSRKNVSKTKITGPEISEKTSYRIGFNGVQSSKVNIGTAIEAIKKDRLKPPPDLSSKLVHKKRKTSHEDELDISNESLACSPADKKTSPAKVTLKRPSLQMKEDHSKPSKIVCTSSKAEGKKQKTKITWP